MAVLLNVSMQTVNPFTAIKVMKLSGITNVATNPPFDFSAATFLMAPTHASCVMSAHSFSTEAKQNH